MLRLLTFLVCILAAPLAHSEVQQIRLTLQQGFPVTDADIGAANSVCLEPYKSPHNQLTTFDGTNWNSFDVAPSTYCLSASGLTANTNYDVLVTESIGVPLMSWSAAWSNDSTPPPRALQNGVEVSAADHTKLVIGAVRVNSIGLLMDSHVCRCLSNYYNPQIRKMWAQDSALTWPDHSPSTGFELAHGNAALQLEYIAVTSRVIAAHVAAQAQVQVPSGIAGGNAMVGIGLNGSLGDVSFPHLHASIWSSAGGAFPTTADYEDNPGIGHVTVSWLERGSATVPSASVVWLGLVPPWNASGISGEVLN